MLPAHSSSVTSIGIDPAATQAAITATTGHSLLLLLTLEALAETWSIDLLSNKRTS